MSSESTVNAQDSLHIDRSLGDVLVPIAGISLAAGIVAVVDGWRCPFTAVGLTCPGCGCTRAVELVRSEGFLEAMRSQPTATALLVVLGLVLALMLITRLWLLRNPQVSRQTDVAGVVVIGIAATVNFAYQLAT